MKKVKAPCVEVTVERHRELITAEQERDEIRMAHHAAGVRHRLIEDQQSREIAAIMVRLDETRKEANAYQQTAHAFAGHKERDAETIAGLVKLLVKGA